eukprot:TRINITY_DN16288_c0_g1_i1.p1 TRINITY_DN16288_c0_g1~~TRINITY_DN16288_c0_g1_i1.p1  ORF type:complete len:662 (-),score=103.90 TRINITY_DN16288_c0_g1_i1:82-2067(-)
MVFRPLQTLLCWHCLVAWLFFWLRPCRGERPPEPIPRLRYRPTAPAAWAKYYPVEDVLNCDGANFSSSWFEFRQAVADNAANNFPIDRDLMLRARQLVQEEAAAVFILYRHTFDPSFLETLERTLGWIEWPLDFSESSGWPTLWRIAMLHLEKARLRGDGSWSMELPQELWGQEFDILPRPSLREVEDELEFWLEAVAGGASNLKAWSSVSSIRSLRTGDSATRSLTKLVARNRGKGVWIQVLGHHLGSSMEPFTMIKEALKVGAGLKVEASFTGQRHPSPGLVCKEFGYCDANPQLEKWFRSYEGRWLGDYEWMPAKWDEALGQLTAIIGSSSLMDRSDMVVCGGPAWFCVMLRTVWKVPMLLYFAWPIASLVPAEFKTHIFASVRTLCQTVYPPTVIVVANWILAAQFALQIHTKVDVQRPHGLYANATYAPLMSSRGRPRVMVTRIGQWARISGVALLETTWSLMEQHRKEKNSPYPMEMVFLSIRIRGTDTNAPVLYKEFAGFHACVFWPWDVMMLLFNEIYSMTVPLVMPHRSWAIRVMFHSLVHTDVNWWHLRGEKVSGALPQAFGPEFPLPFKPWVGKAGESDAGSLAELSYWYELTDFMQFPHITYFESLPDMLQKLIELDVSSIRDGMCKFNAHTLADSIEFYRNAAAELLM